MLIPVISMLAFLFLCFGFLVTLGLSGLAAWSDYKGFRIPNIVSVVIMAAFAMAFGAVHFAGAETHVLGSWKSHVGAAGIVMLVTMLLFALRMIGAGDSKFATAVALWVGMPGLGFFLFYMTFLGGLLGVIALVLKRWKPLSAPASGSWPAKAQEGHNAVPYGIAIAGGALIALIYRGYFNIETWAVLFDT